MEREFFDWKDWCQGDVAEFMFYECTLKEGVLQELGDRFYETISLDYERGLMTFYKDGKELFKYKLTLKAEKHEVPNNP